MWRGSLDLLWRAICSGEKPSVSQLTRRVRAEKRGNTPAFLPVSSSSSSSTSSSSPLIQTACSLIIWLPKNLANNFDLANSLDADSGVHALRNLHHFVAKRCENGKTWSTSNMPEGMFHKSVGFICPCSKKALKCVLKKRWKVIGWTYCHHYTIIKATLLFFYLKIIISKSF